MGNKTSQKPSTEQVINDIQKSDNAIIILKKGSEVIFHTSGINQDEFDMFTSVLRSDVALQEFFFDASMSLLDEENPGIRKKIIIDLANKYKIKL